MYAFPRARQALAEQGVVFEPVVFQGISVAEYVGRLPDLTVVVAAATDREAIRPIATALSTEGILSDSKANVIVGLTTKRGYKWDTQPLGGLAQVSVEENTVLRGMKCRFQVSATADSAQLRVTIGRYDIRAQSGLLLAAMALDGTLLLMQQVSTDDGGRVLVDLPHLPLWRVSSPQAGLSP